jgi:hypothetical protein
MPEEFLEKSRIRGVRRHHRFRMRRRAARLLTGGWWSLPRQRVLLSRAIRRRGDTYSNCSGSCCGNPRRHYAALTWQEQLAVQRHQEMLAELEA